MALVDRTRRRGRGSDHVSSLRRLVFLDPGAPYHPPTLPALMSEAAEDHRRAGTPVIWIQSDHVWDIPAGDQRLTIPEPPFDPAAPLPGASGPVSAAALARTMAVVEAMAQLRVPAAHCFAYSDLCLGESILTLVGNPRVVACRPETAEIARSRGFVVTAVCPPRPGEPERANRSAHGARSGRPRRDSDEPGA